MTKGAGRFVEIIEPVVQYQDASSPQISPVPRPAGLEGKRIAFVANSKPQSVPFMEALAAATSRRLPLTETFLRQPAWDLTNAEGVRQTESEVGALTKECEVVVTGVGD